VLWAADGRPQIPSCKVDAHCPSGLSMICLSSFRRFVSGARNGTGNLPCVSSSIRVAISQPSCRLISVNTTKLQARESVIGVGLRASSFSIAVIVSRGFRSRYSSSLAGEGERKNRAKIKLTESRRQLVVPSRPGEAAHPLAASGCGLLLETVCQTTGI
jgi:hypothetical protein